MVALYTVLLRCRCQNAERQPDRHAVALLHGSLRPVATGHRVKPRVTVPLSTLNGKTQL